MIRKTREGWNCRFLKTPRTEGGDEVPAVWTQGSRQVGLSGAPKPGIYSIPRFGKIFPATFPEFSWRTPEQTPGNSRSLLEFSAMNVLSSYESSFQNAENNKK